MGTKARTYSIFSYADAYFWKKTGLGQRVSDAIGAAYVKEDTQIGNILSQLRRLSEADLAKQVRSYTVECEREEQE